MTNQLSTQQPKSYQGKRFCLYQLSLCASIQYVRSLVLVGCLTVRVHSNLPYRSGAWINLWYLLRGLDISGSGKFEIDFKNCCDLLNRDEKTVYRLLLQAKKRGAIWAYQIKEGVLYGYYKSLFRLCLNQDLDHWGAVSSIALIDLPRQVKNIAVSSTKAYRQHASKKALAACYKSNDRKVAMKRSVEICLDSKGCFNSPKTVRGTKNLILGIDDKYIYGSRSLLTFGTNHNSTANLLRCCTKTIQRKQSGLDKRQIAIAKPEYQRIAMMIDAGMISLNESLYISPTVKITRISANSYELREKIPGTEKFRISSVTRGNFFVGLFDKWYCAFNNFYAVADLPKLESMRRSRSKYKLLRQQKFRANVTERYKSANRRAVCTG